MKIFKGKYYKELYETEKEDNKWLETQLQIRKDKINEQKNVIKKLMEDVNFVSNENEYYESQIEELKEKVERKEQLRRKVAGKVGGLTAEKHKLLNEKQEMLKLINKLLEEIRKNSKERYKPTLKELKEYFKIKY